MSYWKYDYSKDGTIKKIRSIQSEAKCSVGCVTDDEERKEIDNVLKDIESEAVDVESAYTEKLELCDAQEAKIDKLSEMVFNMLEDHFEEFCDELQERVCSKCQHNKRFYNLDHCKMKELRKVLEEEEITEDYYGFRSVVWCHLTHIPKECPFFLERTLMEKEFDEKYGELDE